MKRKRYTPKIRRRRLIAAAIAVAKELGLFKVDMTVVSKKEGVSRTLVYQYFKTAKELQAEVIKFAIQKSLTDILQQALIMKHPEAEKNKTKINSLFSKKGLPCL